MASRPSGILTCSYRRSEAPKRGLPALFLIEHSLMPATALVADRVTQAAAHEDDRLTCTVEAPPERWRRVLNLHAGVTIWARHRGDIGPGPRARVRPERLSTSGAPGRPGGPFALRPRDPLDRPGQKLGVYFSEWVQHHAPWCKLVLTHLDASAQHKVCTQCKVQSGALTTMVHQVAGAHRRGCT